MLNICVCCGEVIPEGQQVCDTCLRGGPNCPECGNELAVMNTHCEASMGFCEQVTLYNCSNCCSDWEKRVGYMGAPVEFKRKLWG